MAETAKVIEDAVLGKLTWGGSGWDFTFPLDRGRQGRGSIMVAFPDQGPTAENVSAVCSYIGWFRRQEGALRAHIAEKMFDGWRSGWYDSEIDRTHTRLGFQRKLSLSGILFYCDEGWVCLVYNDGNLFGGHGISFSTNWAGEIDGDPMLFG